ncbi:hypothetical protein JCGZ_23381 [Jatropha curcas]|uniref:Kinesin-like protein n=1 Tax=Jatropha curcas TaxID=180498 RepID=A0A067JL35_JATCU|nr:hypothetical protein JCGZ_23381 [Jatropha curcas]
MSNVTVCCRFRPLSSKEKRDDGDSVCIRSLDTETFIFKDEKEEESTFSFDRVFYKESVQSDVYQFLALPIIQGAVNAINGTIITYGQTGAGKTYSMEGPNILERDELTKGLLPRVVDGLFQCTKSVDGSDKHSIKLSMVEIYMEKVSSRSHCIYIFTVQRELTETRAKTGKVVLVDLAGSEKVEKTGAEGKVLEEAKTINKSLSALGNVINALTCGSPTKASHIPYRDSKLTRILQDALGGNSRTVLLCCCSPSTSNATETLSTLRFGTRAKHIKASPFVNRIEDKLAKQHGAVVPSKDESCERILNRLRERLDVEDVEFLEDLFRLEGILFDPNSVDDLESACEDISLRTISSLQQALEELVFSIEELQSENKALKSRIAAAKKSNDEHKETIENASVMRKILDILSSSMLWVRSFPLPKMLK